MSNKADESAYHIGIVIPPKWVGTLPLVVHTNAELFFYDEEEREVMVRVAILSGLSNDRYFSAN